MASFIKEFVVKLPEGEHLEFEAGGYIQIDVPACEVDFKNMDITAHPELGRWDVIYRISSRSGTSTNCGI
ncbi:MAG: hypothetical protein IPG11_04295 [Flavobacteriales bacterium]|nr:hypothetical protein [Flavobacteriales bacterium]